MYWLFPKTLQRTSTFFKPLVERILNESGRKAIVEVCRNPNFQGVHAALNLDALRSKVVARYPMVNLFILFVDRDGNEGRKTRTDSIENALSAELQASGRRFLAEVAWQEVEVFILAGLALPADWRWAEIRDDADVKNTFFERLVALRGTAKQPHQGRKKLMAEAITNWQRIKSRCPEDVGALISRVSSVV